MFTSLPDFTPRDSHSIWYRSSRSPFPAPGAVDNSNGDSQNHHHGANHPRQRGNMLERSALARLIVDEQYMQRRRLNIQNYGSGWLKPPGVPKTLHQMREEKKEQEEHQEALRREQLAQELAEAEQQDAPEDGMDDVQLDGAQDLDDEIPDADDDFGLPDDDDDEEEDDTEEDLDEDEDEDEDDDGGEAEESMLREERQNDLIAARMRMNDDAFREALVRGDGDGEGLYGGDEDIEEDEGHMLGEDDFGQDGTEDGLGMDMDADLDDDIPEAEDGGYEHTDSEAELSSSEEEDDDDDDDDEDEDADMSFAPRSAVMGPPQSPTLHGRPSLPPARLSMDISNLLSQDGSSFMDSSPAAGRRARQ